MSAALKILSCGPAVSLQDLGRPGHIAEGLTKGGAMDPLALREAATLLNQPLTAALEMTGMGGSFEATADTAIALTGAPMQATLDGAPLRWHACHLLPKGTRLEIGGVRSGAIGYLSVANGFATDLQMGSRSAHVSAGLGRNLAAGDTLPITPGPARRTGYGLTPPDRFHGGTVRMVRSLQSALYGEDLLKTFTETRFTRDARANRQGIRLAPPEGTSFLAQGGLTVVSEIIAPGDIQVTGDGAPFVLMREHQTTGGYPRIGTVLPCDLPRIAQAPLNAEIHFDLLDLADAIAAERKARTAGVPTPAPLIRDPADIPDLLSYTLIGGMITGYEEDMT
jgi:allophanate hydrolase